MLQHLFSSTEELGGDNRLVSIQTAACMTLHLHICCRAGSIGPSCAKYEELGYVSHCLIQLSLIDFSSYPFACVVSQSRSLQVSLQKWNR